MVKPTVRNRISIWKMPHGIDNNLLEECDRYPLRGTPNYKVHT